MKQAIIQWNYFAFTCKGKMYSQNEDRVLIDNQILESGSSAGTGEKRLLAAICDGIGGEVGGARAAEITVEYFRTMEKDITSIYAISEAAMTVNESICHMQMMDCVSRNMSTTIAGLTIWGDRFLAFNIGDTRIYIDDQGGFRQISKDHTVAQTVREQGVISNVQDVPEASRNIVTHYLGGKQGVWFPALYRGTLGQQATTFMLCSDGIYKKVKHCELSGITRSGHTVEEKGQAIVDRAIHNGLTDDMSVILIETSV